MPPINIPLIHATNFAKSVQKNIIEEGWIDSAINAAENPAMLALVQLYIDWIPGDAETKDPNCWQCRGKILNSFALMKPYLRRLAGFTVRQEDFVNNDYKKQYLETYGEVGL